MKGLPAEVRILECIRKRDWPIGRSRDFSETSVGKGGWTSLDPVRLVTDANAAITNLLATKEAAPEQSQDWQM